MTITVYDFLMLRHSFRVWIFKYFLHRLIYILWCRWRLYLFLLYWQFLVSKRKVWMEFLFLENIGLRLHVFQDVLYMFYFCFNVQKETDFQNQLSTSQMSLCQKGVLPSLRLLKLPIFWLWCLSDRNERRNSTSKGRKAVNEMSARAHTLSTHWIELVYSSQRTADLKGKQIAGNSSNCGFQIWCFSKVFTLKAKIMHFLNVNLELEILNHKFCDKM